MYKAKVVKAPKLDLSKLLESDGGVDAPGAKVQKEFAEPTPLASV